MSISDSNGPTAARPDSSNRSTSTRSTGDSARYQGDLTGSGGSSDSGSSSGDTGSVGGTEGQDLAPGDRPCAYVIYSEVWTTAEDEKVCPECAPLDGKWYEQGHGPQPPLHDHCRCTRTVVWWDCYQSDGSWEKGGRVYG